MPLVYIVDDEVNIRQLAALGFRMRALKHRNLLPAAKCYMPCNNECRMR